MKTYVTIVHFNKPRASSGFPWTVHYRGQCIPAKTVTILGRSETVFKPEKKTNPRAWIRVQGVVTNDAGHITIES